MKRIILLIFFFTAVYLLNAQDSSRVWSLKVSLPISYVFSDNPPVFDGIQAHAGIIKKNVIHEFGVEKINSSTNYTFFGYREFERDLNVGYKFLYKTFSAGNHYFYATGGISNYWNRYKQSPEISTQFKYVRNRFALISTLGVSYRWNISKKTFIDVNIDGSIYSLEYVRRREFDPSLSKNDQIDTRLYKGVLGIDEYGILRKIGFGIKL